MSSTDVLIVDWLGQCYNDALHYSELARRIGIEKPFEYWRNCTASIIMSALCMEAFLHEMIKWKLSEMDDELVVQFLESKTGFDHKLELIDTLLELKLDKSDKAWMQIKKTIDLRNDIVHFTRNTIFNDIKLENAEIAIQATRDLIKKFFNAMEQDYHPRWKFIDEDESKNFDN